MIIMGFEKTTCKRPTQQLWWGRVANNDHLSIEKKLYRGKCYLVDLLIEIGVNVALSEKEKKKTWVDA